MIGWPEVFRLLARRYGWSPAEILALTVTQAAMFLGARTADDARTILISQEQYEAMMESRNSQATPETLHRLRL